MSNVNPEYVDAKPEMLVVDEASARVVDPTVPVPSMPPQLYKHQVGAMYLLAMLDLLEEAPEGASVVCGGAFMRKSNGWTKERIASARAYAQAAVDAPTIPDKIWHDRVPSPAKDGCPGCR